MRGKPLKTSVFINAKHFIILVWFCFKINIYDALLTFLSLHGVNVDYHTQIAVLQHLISKRL